jgi:hypothetical protein
MSAEKWARLFATLDRKAEEKGRAPGPTSAPPPASTTTPKAPRSINGAGAPSPLFRQANDVPVRDVLDWLGLIDGDELMCPGCRERGAVEGRESVAVLERANGLKCSHDRCADKGKNGLRSNVDLVSEVRGVKPFEAAKAIAEHFGLASDPPAPVLQLVPAAADDRPVVRPSSNIKENGDELVLALANRARNIFTRNGLVEVARSDDTKRRKDQGAVIVRDMPLMSDKAESWSLTFNPFML